jgi:alpha-tubulin suppressor-like RCC1 family protein
MSGYLWKSYLEDDVATFRAVLESAGLSARAAASKSLGGGPGIDGVDHECASPPHTPAKHGRGQPPTPQGLVLARADLNHRDSQGRTLLHLAASSSAPTAILFARALLEHPLTDIYLQDSENGWTALHRAFYAGNASIALAILSRDSDDSRTAGTVSLRQGGLVKIKDHEGNGPFDVLEETLDEIDRSGSDYFIYQPEYEERPLDWIDPPAGQRPHRTWQGPWNHTGGDEVYTFGSNKNMTLGFGDEDDRHYPERSILKRPEYLIEKYLVRSQERAGSDRKTFLTQFVLPKELSRVPFSIRYNPCRIQDVVMGKYSSAILTSDISSNLHLCGHGTSGRLGLGTQETMYQFTCVEGPLEGRRVVAVALGHHHTLALCTGGDVFSWGSNALGQLGYVLPNQSKDDDPMQLLPRQIYGTLKREKILGIAASGIHSVCFNEGSIFTFGKNEGQLGIMDADARSLSTQSTPRKVGGQQFSHRIRAVSAIDRATICLLDNHDVWVYANYGYSKVLFVNDPFSNQYLQSISDPGNDTAANHHAKESARSRLSLVIKVASGGDTICALTTLGEIYSITIGKPAVTGQHSSTSTTNPAKIRSALSQPQRIWSNRKSRMAARDLDVDQNGSVILATRAGGVWRRTKRAQIKDANANGSSDYREKDYKFSRIPGLTSALGVRASGFGAYAAVRKEFELHVHSRIKIESTLREDLFHLSPFKSWESILEKSGEAHHSTVTSFALALARRFKDGCPDPDSLFRDIFSESSKSHGFEPDLVMCTSSSDVGIPFHQFLAAACGPGLQRGLFKCWRTGAAYEDETCMISKENGGLRLVFRRLDVLTVVNLAYFATTGTVLPMWQQQSARMESRLRNVRSETSRLAWALKNKNLENAFRSDAEQSTGLEAFFSYLPAQPSTLPGTDAVIELEDGEIRAHSVLLCQRCPFFSGLFLGRARGMWVADRMTDGAIRIDFSHVEMWIFERVLRWVYTDASETLFEDLIAEDVDDYLDKIFDVLGLANELMIDMLVKVCQKAISKHGTLPVLDGIVTYMSSHRAKCRLHS